MLPPTGMSAWVGGGVLAEGSGELSRGLLWLFGILVGAAALAGVILFGIRKIALGRDVSSPAGQSIEQIEKLRRDGLLSDEEYKRARRTALGLPPAGPAAGQPPDTAPADADPQ